MRRLILILLATLAVSGMAADAGFVCKARRPGDSLTAGTNASARVFTVSSPTGIGGGTVTLTNGAWPEHVSIFLKNFKALEGFTLVTGRMRVEGSLRESGRMPFSLADASGNFTGTNPPAGYLGIIVQKRMDGLEIILPAKFLAGEKQFEIEWIDAYR